MQMNYQLRTNLEHLNSRAEVEQLITKNEKAVVVCGRMGPMCIPVYEAMEELLDERENVKFYTISYFLPFYNFCRLGKILNPAVYT